MNDDPDLGARARRVDVIFKIILVGLICLWVIFPPSASHPSVAKPAGPAVTAALTR